MIQGNHNLNNERAVRGLFSFNPRHNMVVGMVISAYFFLVSAGGIPVRLLMRKNMGERAFSFMALVSSFVFFLISGFILYYVALDICYRNGFGMPVPSVDGFFGFDRIPGVWETSLLALFTFLANPLMFLLILIFGIGASHFKSKIVRSDRGNFGYSRYRGDSIHFAGYNKEKVIGIKVNEQVIRMVIEPVSVLKISFPSFMACSISLACCGLFKVDSGMDFWLFNLLVGFLLANLLLSFSALFVFLEELGILVALRNAALDMVDAEAESKLILQMKERFSHGMNLTAGDTGILEKKETSKKENDPQSPSFSSIVS